VHPACVDCGANLRVSREPHKYTLHPRWAVTIADAEVRRCPRCGYFEVAIPKPDALHRTIAVEVIRKPARLSGPELAFLRSQLGMSARALARMIGVVHESISRWENDVLRISPPVDRLMRTMIALKLDGPKFPVETLSHIEGDAGPVKMVVTVQPDGSWRRAA
jgi:putative zinc finger/helix-turn-helix YgiT family protein